MNIKASNAVKNAAEDIDKPLLELCKRQTTQVNIAYAHLVFCIFERHTYKSVVTIANGQNSAAGRNAFGVCHYVVNGCTVVDIDDAGKIRRFACNGLLGVVHVALELREHYIGILKKLLDSHRTLLSERMLLAHVDLRLDG